MDNKNVTLGEAQELTLDAGGVLGTALGYSPKSVGPVKIDFDGGEVQLLDAISRSRRAAEASGTNQIELSYDGISLCFTTDTTIRDISQKYFAALHRNQ